MSDVPFPGESSPGDATSPSETPRCSAKGCREAAEFDLQWRNPRLHDAARVKHWLACGEHVESLASYLSVRGFLIDRGPLS